MNGKNGSLGRSWIHVGLTTLLAMMLLVTLVACERSKSSGLPTVEPAATSAISKATVSASPTTITVDKSDTPSMEPPQPTAVPPTATSTLPPAPTKTPVSGGTTYTVQPGDTLYSIARRYDMTVDELMRLNGITDPGALRVGQKLTISPGATGATPVPGQETVHVVQRGENLFRIAQRYGVTVEAIAKRNGIVNPSLIWTGQRLIIPATTGAPVTGDIHVVQPGQNLYRISLIYGTTVQAIMQANKLSSTMIYVGQRLRIP